MRGEGAAPFELLVAVRTGAFKRLLAGVEAQMSFQIVLLREELAAGLYGHLCVSGVSSGFGTASDVDDSLTEEVLPIEGLTAAEETFIEPGKSRQSIGS